MKFFTALLALTSLATLAAGETCTNPKVTATSYTNSDAQVLTHIAFIAEFSLACGNGAKNVNLFADVKGALTPVIRSADGAKYQVSWVEEVKAAKTGDYSVSLYDDEGYAAVKRVMERGEMANVKPLVTIVVNYPGAYKGSYINSELLAAIMGILVFYLAYSSKAKLLA